MILHCDCPKIDAMMIHAMGEFMHEKKAADKALDFEGGDMQFSVSIIASMLTQAKHIEQNTTILNEERNKNQ
jgi:hypothetical protein